MVVLFFVCILDIFKTYFGHKTHTLVHLFYGIINTKRW